MENTTGKANYEEIRRMYENFLRMKSDNTQLDCIVLSKEELKSNGKEHK